MMRNSKNTHQVENTIVKFHLGRGGKFNNAGHLTFQGLSRIDEGDAYEGLFLNEDETEYHDGNGNPIGLTVEEAESGIGRIDIDGEYNTTYTKLLKNCENKEVSIIWDSEYNYDYILEELKIKDFDILRVFKVEAPDVFWSDDLTNTCDAECNGIEEIDEDTYDNEEDGYIYEEVNGKFYRKEI